MSNRSLKPPSYCTRPTYHHERRVGARAFPLKPRGIRDPHLLKTPRPIQAESVTYLSSPVSTRSIDLPNFREVPK